MKTPKNPVDNGRNTVLAASSLKLRLAMVVGWSLLTLLLAISLTAQPARAQKVDPGQLPSSITMTQSVKHGRNAITLNVNTPHSAFRYYDKVDANHCRQIRNWFDFYMINTRDDDEEIRQSGEYNIYQRDSSKKLCILVVFDDFREDEATGYGYGPFSFDQGQPPANNNQNNTGNQPDNNQPVITKKTVSGTIDYDRNLEPPDESKMLIELHDTSVQDSASQLITKKTLTSFGNPPHKFKLDYNPKNIKERNTYSLQVSVIDADGNLLLINDVAVDVITRNNPTNVHINLVPTRHLTQPDNTEDQTDNEQHETEQQTEPSTQETRKPLPLQMKKSQRPTEAPQPEPEAIDQTTPEKATEDTSQEPEAPAEQTTEPPVATDQPIPITITIEEPATADPSATEPQTEETNKTRSDLIWLGAYIVVALTVGAVSLLLLNKKDR